MDTMLSATDSSLVSFSRDSINGCYRMTAGINSVLNSSISFSNPANMDQTSSYVPLLALNLPPQSPFFRELLHSLPNGYNLTGGGLILGEMDMERDMVGCFMFLLQPVGVAGGLRAILTDQKKLVVAVGGVTALATGIYTTREGVRVVWSNVDRILGQPSLIRESSRGRYTCYAGAIFADACLKGLNGVPDVVECSFVQSNVTELPFFAYKVRLGKNGIEEVLGLGSLTDYEKQGLEALLPELKSSIEKGIKFANQS